MKLLGFKKFLEEVQELNLVELGKPATKDQSRGDVLISKIRKGEELTTTNDKSVVVKKMKSGDDWVEPEDAIDDLTNNDNSYDLEKGKKYFTKPRGTRFNYVPVFKANGEELRLNQIKKTKDFGSKGAGVRTQKFETVQCIFLAIKQSYNVDLKPDDDSFKEFFLKYVQDLTTRPEESPNIFLPKKVKIDYELLEEFLDDKAWIKTFCDVSNTLWNSPFINPNLKYHIFHPSYIGDFSPYTAIEKKYKDFAKEEKFTDINISKYCPADVYLIEIQSQEEIIKKINSIKTLEPSEARPGEPHRGIEILSKVMNEYFDARTLIPISLKKIVDGYKVITNDDIKTNPPEFFIKTFHFGKDLKGIGSKISTTSIWQDKEGRPVESKDRTINFDSSDTGKNVDVDGEIEGSSSRHGKISFKAITRLLRKWCTLGRITMNIQSHSELRNYTNEQLLEMVNKLIATVNELKDPQDGEIIQVRSITRGTDIQNSKNKLISRLQSMQIVYTIYLLREVKHALAQRAITSIMRYALSIETDKFKSPRYLRII